MKFAQLHSDKISGERLSKLIRQKEMDGGQLMSHAWREQQIVSSPAIMARNEIQHAFIIEIVCVSIFLLNEIILSEHSDY